MLRIAKALTRAMRAARLRYASPGPPRAIRAPDPGPDSEPGLLSAREAASLCQTRDQLVSVLASLRRITPCPAPIAPRSVERHRDPLTGVRADLQTALANLRRMESEHTRLSMNGRPEPGGPENELTKPTQPRQDHALGAGTRRPVPVARRAATAPSAQGP